MELTEYIWDLYRKSDKAKGELSMFGRSNIDKLSLQFEFDLKVEYKDNKGTLKYYQPYHLMVKDLKGYKITNISEARNLFKEIIIDPIVEEKDEKYNFFFEYIGAFSTALYHCFPDYFLPYYFTKDNYSDFIRLCNNFEIVLPPNPYRHSQEKRAWFYFEICETLHQFRRKHNILSEDFPALLYYFGLKSLPVVEETELPKPSRIYFLGAGAGIEEENNWDFRFLDNLTVYSSKTWGAGGLKIKKGDLVLMYCLSPRKYLHSIWRAIEDSFIDPFSYYYYGVKVAFPQKIPPISFQELKINSVFRDNSTVKANMQGLNGRSLTVKEYVELLKMIEEKGSAINNLPKLPVYDRVHVNIENERDVEIQLVEPLLLDLGFKEKDWIRQFPLKMGRQLKYYPDYAILANITKGIEKAKIILETKYSISSHRQLEDCFYQARSYGLRMQSEKIILAERDFIWVYQKTKADFEPNPVLKFHWNDLTNSDNLCILKERLLK
jgi:hypothetical protein